MTWPFARFYSLQLIFSRDSRNARVTFLGPGQKAFGGHCNFDAMPFGPLRSGKLVPWLRSGTVRRHQFHPLEEFPPAVALVDFKQPRRLGRARRVALEFHF